MSGKPRTHERVSATLDVRKILEQFQEAEESKAHRKGTFKIDAPFERALDTILKSKPHVPPKKRTA